jgi:hypothetical protein
MHLLGSQFSMCSITGGTFDARHPYVPGEVGQWKQGLLVSGFSGIVIHLQTFSSLGNDMVWVLASEQVSTSTTSGIPETQTPTPFWKVQIKQDSIAHHVLFTTSIFFIH